MASSIWVTWPALTKYGSLGVLAALLSLSSERTELLENNLFDVEDYARYNAAIHCDERSHTARTEDGTCNILENPAEGSVYRRFGHNVALDAVSNEVNAGTLLSPNPRDVSNSLLARKEFKPATSVNFIAAAWIQFMVHDWVDHEIGGDADPIQVPLPAGDKLGSGYLSIKRTGVDPTREADEAALPPTYRNRNTHWWDGSQLYGSSKEVNDELRSFVDGKLKLNDDGTLPTELLSGIPKTGFSNNWWLGLSMMHQLFVQEHNTIAGMLKANYPDKDDQWLYDKARLINAALMAKIHTVEWTPAIIANPVTERAMNANWWGLLGDNEYQDWYQEQARLYHDNLATIDQLSALFGIETHYADEAGAGSLDHAIGGIVGSAAPNNYGTPFTLTEEFVAVYRMHPLLRDNVDVYDIGSNVVSKEIPLQDTRDGEAEAILADEGADRLWYSFGITYPGSLTLHNYPEFLRNISIPLRGDIDLATTDIVRDRERGVPRYNEFRRQIGLNPITKFEDLTTDPATLAELKRVYGNDIEKIDTLVGMLGETVRPEGFAFGETAFQIFIMNASRRLMTDRFYTQDFTADMYTPEGMAWINNTTMVDVLRRHNPSLASSLVGQDNAFKPWGLHIPDDYNNWQGCTKQQHLWLNGAMRTEYPAGERPALAPVDTLGLIDSILWDKVKKVQDVAPAGYEKPIHPYGALATASFVSTGDHAYTGLFKGNECGMLRMSVTGDPADMGAFAPGLAWKSFVDGKRSENVSALYTLTGQGKNYNIFANEMSNYVLPESDSWASMALFSLVTTQPTRLMVNDMAKVKQDGTKEATVKSPTQIYFVPTAGVKNLFGTGAHDFRDDLTTLKAGTTVYDVYATDMTIKTSIFPWLTESYKKERRASAKKIGEIRLTSDFTTSAFGDGGIFFKHQRYEDK